MAKSLKKAVAEKAEPKEEQKPIEEQSQTVTVEKNDKKKIDEDINLISASIPDGVVPVEVKLDPEEVVNDAWEKFNKRASTSTFITNEMVDATRDVIQLISDGATWNESEELRAAFRKAPNSFAKGPVISTELQILCGKVVKFDTKDVPIYRTGLKIGGRHVYQDDLGFLRIMNRFPISAAEAEDTDKEADPQGSHTYLSHSAHRNIDFWCCEPQHQIHDHVTSKTLKKPVSSKKIATKEDQAAILKQRLAMYERLLKSASDESTKKTTTEKISYIKAKLSELEAA